VTNAIPDLPCISDYVAYHARSRPAAEALVLDDERITYAQLESRVNALAAALLAAGIGRGDRVATLCTPSPAYMTAFLATASIGAIWVGLNPKYARSELAYVLKDSGPRLLLTRTKIGSRGYAEDIGALVTDCGTIERIVTLDEYFPIPDAKPLAEFIHEGEAHLCALATVRARVRTSDACLIVYTSGSTGRPKGAVHTHGSLAGQVQSLSEAWEWSPLDAIPNVLPLHHTHGLVNVTLCARASGARVEMPGGFDADACWRRLEEGWLTLFMAVPTVYAKLAAAWEAADAATRARRSASCRRLRLMVSGSAALPVPAPAE